MPQLSRLWRLVVTDLEGATVTMLDHLATERNCTPVLGDALQFTGTVPSDNPQINLLHTDGFPYLAEGVRQLYGLRNEPAEPTDPVAYNVRASTLIMQLDDAAREDDARTRFTAYDPWQYMMSRPVLVSANTTEGATGQLPAGTVAGDLIPPVGIKYPQDMSADQIVMDMITTTIDFGDRYASPPLAALNLFIDHGQFGGGSTNIQETCAVFTLGYPVQQGISLGQALKDMMATGVMDIILRPIYDPANRPGILCAIEILKQDLTVPTLGAGSYNYDAIFAWDRPGRNMTGVDNLYDGTGRANIVQFYSGQGGPPIVPQTDADSIEIYGEYEVQQFYPATQQILPAVITLAAEQLALRSRYKETLTVNPAPERAPEPFIDYDLGDAVPDFMSNRMRQALPPETLSAGANGVNSGIVNVVSTNQFPDATPGTPHNIVIAGKLVSYTGKTATSFTGCGSHAATVSGEKITTAAWQRIFGIPIDIDDNSIETVRELLVGPVGAPP